MNARGPHCRCRARAWLALGIALQVLAAARAAAFDAPSDVYADLFARVQTARIYPDSKTFADCTPVRPPAQILAEYRAASQRPGFDLAAFVRERFTPPTLPKEIPVEPGKDVREHIDQLWHSLERKPDEVRPYSSLLPLPQRYVVPGGRFVEIYYWDSYFTMLGLEASRRHDLTLAMLANFASLIETYGFIPNGNRSYYLSRSQPPFFALMVELVARTDGEETYKTYLPQLKREYAFWMDGAASLQPGAAQRRVVRMPDGSLLNRYWDGRDTPRDEAYREDVLTASQSGRPLSEVYRNLRAAAESGWDFSSRWFADGKTLGSIRTTELVPPDLNSLLYQLERTILKACAQAGDKPCSTEMRARAESRRLAISRYLWNEKLGAFSDYDWRAGKRVQQLSAATLYPLFVGVSSQAQASTVAATVRARLLQPFGVATTTLQTDQQWDASNGWAPLQWIAIQGLRSHGATKLAAEIAARWVAINLRVYRESGKLLEKYGTEAVGGGEYATQIGFGWTNGVLRSLLALYPQLAPSDATTAK